jgi:hypothetical protein
MIRPVSATLNQIRYWKQIQHATEAFSKGDKKNLSNSALKTRSTSTTVVDGKSALLRRSSKNLRGQPGLAITTPSSAMTGYEMRSFPLTTTNPDDPFRGRTPNAAVNLPLNEVQEAYESHIPYNKKAVERESFDKSEMMRILN